MRWRAFGANTIIFTSIDTYICVESSVRDAFNKGYDVVLLKDCVASKGRGYHEATLGQVAESYGWVLTTAELVKKIDAGEPTLQGLGESRPPRRLQAGKACNRPRPQGFERLTIGRGPRVSPFRMPGRGRGSHK